MTTRYDDLVERRITDYLSGGGLFNPELAKHDAVRDLVIDCRDAIEALQAEREKAEQLVRDMGVELARTNALANQIPVWRELAARFSIPPFAIRAALAALGEKP